MTTAPPRPMPRPGILDISPYVPGNSEAPGAARVFKLSSNETPLGPSPHAQEAFRKIAGKLEMYPDGDSTALRAAIGKAHGLDPARIMCGAGSDELFTLLAQGYLTAGDEGVFTEHGFLMYRIVILAAGARPVAVPETNFQADVDAILSYVTPRTKIVFLANPNNPTGTYLSFEEIKRLHVGLPPHVLLVLDAAYAEYVARNDYDNGFGLVDAADNVVVTRTFSKAYGLAALRLGWMYGPAEIISTLNRFRDPFNVSAAAQAAGIAAMEDREHLAAAVAHNERWRKWLTEEISALELTVTPSAANFVLIHFPDRPGCTAVEADAFLLKRGLVLRQVGGYGLPNALRLTVGSEEANRLVVEALSDFVGERRV